jgi:TolB-like protein/class 3 adenylate cyclase/Tfp pilus assembly protein PilF
MATEVKKEIALEIAHILFIDIVAYSKMATDDQRAAVEELSRIVQSTDEYRAAQSENRLLKLTTGDGMALIFYHSPEDPVECALEISRAIKEQHSDLRLRMGVHSGPVSGVVDVNERTNVAGSGINMAQRVMDCGDAGHILLSKRVAEDLEQFKHWRPHLHQLGECEVKHGEKIEIINLFTPELGNSDRPQRLTRPFQKAEPAPAAIEQPKPRKSFPILGACALIAALAIAAYFFWQHQNSKTSAVGVPEKSVAVLPFENLSEEKANAFFADGVQDQILTALAKVADLKVISRTSVMQYKSGVARNLREIGQQLGVAHLLEGSVQRSATKVRVNAQLINASTDAHEWAENYDRPVDDLFAIQSEIAKAIADQLQAKLSPNEKKAIEQPPTTDLAAFDIYTRAKSLLLTTSFSVTGDPDLRKAIELLDEAVKRDPSFFDAYCQLAWAHENLYAVQGTDHTPARLALAEAAVQAATRLRPDAGETHFARAQYFYNGPRDYAGALAELESARRTLPNDPRIFELTGYILRRRGQQEEGLRHLQRAVELDPRNFFTLQQIALSYSGLRRFAEAIAALDRALSIVPDNVETRAARAQYYLTWKADTQPLHQTIDAILEQGPGAIAPAADIWFLCALAEHDPAAAERALAALGDNSWGESTIALSRSFGEGLLARMTNDEPRAHAAFEAARAEQEKRVQAQPDYGPALCVLAIIDAALGHKELAVEEGRRAIALTPMEKDVSNGSRVLQYFAITAAWTGDKELALQQLETGLRAPVASQALSFGALKLLPFWDPLRGDLRFEKIVASLAPKEPASTAK